MISTRVKFNGKKVRLAGFGPQKYQMFALAQAGLKSIKMRVLSGTGSNDAVMPPLETKGKGTRYSIRQGKMIEFDKGNPYPTQKRRAGLKPIRDLVGFGKDGHMLDDLRVTYADPKLARIDITRGSSRMKARANEQRAPWWGLSPRDVVAVTVACKRIFKGMVEGIRIALKPAGRKAPIWMDPVGLNVNAGDVALPIVSRMPVRVAAARVKAGKMMGRRRSAA